MIIYLHESVTHCPYTENVIESKIDCNGWTCTTEGNDICMGGNFCSTM